MSAGAGTVEARRFGRFELRGEIGSGAMGTVHRAFDPEAGREVALKVLALPLAAFAEAERRELLGRFEREARLAGSLDHPGIARVRGAGEAEGVPWIAMDLVLGETLASLVARRRRERDFLKEAVSLVAQAADALDSAHRHGVIHRDVKPANVLVEAATGRARVTDFGLAREVSPGSRLTQDGQVIGTPQYMAPEQARGEIEAIDAQTDVYGLGATLYEVLTGRPPYTGEVPWKVALEVIRGEFEPPREVNIAVPAELDAVCRCALSPRKEGRYTSAAEFAAELRAWLESAGSVRGRPLAPRGPSLGYVVRLAVRQHKTVTATIAIALAVIVAGTAFFLWRLRVMRNRAERRAAIAREALDVLVYEVRDQLRDLPGERVRNVRQRLLESAVAGVERLRDAVIEDEPASLAAAEAQRQVGDLALEAGLADRAAGAFERALAISREAAADEPESDAARLDVALSLDRVGRIRRELGDPAGALHCYEEALGLQRSLRGAEPAAATACANLAAALGRVGEVRREQGDLDGALAAFEEALAEARAGLAVDPESPAARRALATALDDAGGAHLERGDVAGALEAHEQSLAFVREIVAADPRSPGARRDLAAALERVGAVRQARGDPAGARHAFEEALAIARDLLAGDPSSVAAHRAVSAALDLRGAARAAGGDLAGALVDLDESIAVARRLLGQDPQNQASRRSLSGSLARAGEFRLDEGDLAGARRCLEEAVALRRDLARAPRAEADARRALASALGALGEVLQAEGDHDGARARLAEAVAECRVPAEGGARIASERALNEGKLAEAERVAALLAGGKTPEGPADHLALAYVFFRRQEWARSSEHFAAALADPAIRADLDRENLYNAAAAAARAAAATRGTEAAGWRERALEWLEADLAERRAKSAGTAALAAHLERARAGDPNFAGLRASPAFERLFHPAE